MRGLHKLTEDLRLNPFFELDLINPLIVDERLEPHFFHGLREILCIPIALLTMALCVRVVFALRAIDQRGPFERQLLAANSDGEWDVHNTVSSEMLIGIGGFLRDRLRRRLLVFFFFFGNGGIAHAGHQQLVSGFWKARPSI